MVKINILTGSVRPGRFNIQPATWLYNLAKERTDLKVELIDVQELHLPFLDEPVPPSQQQYSKEHTIAWSKRITEADGFVFITPEYNHSISPVLKNAIDYLFVEWHYKPVSFVSYGSLAGGARAVEHWRGIAAELNMFDLREQIMLPNYWDDLSGQGEFKFTDRHDKNAHQILDKLIFWAEVMKEARGKITQ